jgi:hypothetical protein
MNLKNFAQKLDHFDIYYNQSDDHRLWDKNMRLEDQLRDILNSLSSEEQEDVFKRMKNQKNIDFFKTSV